MIALTDTATNRSTKVLEVTFTDTSGESAVPTSATWSLTDEFGNIINDREDVAITVASTVKIALYGDDLDQELSSDRVFTVKAVYSSDEYGSSLPGRQQASFSIDEWVEPEAGE